MNNTVNTVTSDILGNRLQLAHLKDGFQTSIDSVLVAAACPIKSGQSLLDLGCGIGSAGLCVAERVQNIQLTGIDIQPEVIELAIENAKSNEKQASFISGDVRDYKEQNLYDHIICNPPYLESGKHLRSPEESKATAMGHSEASLEDWVKTAHRALKPHGCLTLIHRADQIDKILQCYERRFGGIEIIPLWPYKDQEAKRIIIRALRDRKTPTRIHAGLILHQEGGDYTMEAQDILAHMKGLNL